MDARGRPAGLSGVKSNELGKEKLKPVFYSPDKEQLKAFLLQEIGVPSVENVKLYDSIGRFVLWRDKGLNVEKTVYNDQFVDWVEDIYVVEEFFNELFYDENGKPKDYETLDDLDREMEQLFKEKKELLKELINRSFFLKVNKYFTDADLRSIFSYYLTIKMFREFDKDSKNLYDEKGNLRLFIEDVKDFDEERMRGIAEKIEEFIDFSGKTLKYFIEAADMNNLRPLLMRLLQAEYFMIRFAHESYRILRKEIEEYREKKWKKDGASCI